MKEVKLAITPALITLLGLSDDPTPSEVGKGITALHDRAEKAEKTLQDLKDEQTGKEVDAHLSTAFTAKKITPEQKVLLKKQYATKPNDLKDLLDSMVGFSSVVNKINQENTERQGEGTLNLSGDDKNLFDQGWDKLHKSGKLKDLKDTNEPAWRELYKGKYGYYPNEKPQRK